MTNRSFRDRDWENAALGRNLNTSDHAGRREAPLQPLALGTRTRTSPMTEGPSAPVSSPIPRAFLSDCAPD